MRDEGKIKMKTLLMWNAAVSVLRPQHKRKEYKRMPIQIDWNIVHQNLIDTWIPLVSILLLFVLVCFCYKNEK